MIHSGTGEPTYLIIPAQGVGRDRHAGMNRLALVYKHHDRAWCQCQPSGMRTAQFLAQGEHATNGQRGITDGEEVILRRRPTKLVPKEPEGRCKMAGGCDIVPLLTNSSWDIAYSVC